MALIRQYEIKDRKERKQLANKRRLLEKAKLKGRKGKKQTKNAAKAANGVHQQPLNQQAYDQQPLDQLGGDDYLDDGYDDDSVPLPAPPPAPLKQSMPGAYDANVGRHTTADGDGKGNGRRMMLHSVLSAQVPLQWWPVSCFTPAAVQALLLPRLAGLPCLQSPLPRYPYVYRMSTWLPRIL